MTIELTELEIIEDVTFDDEDDDHIICVNCYPGYQPGVFVLSVCGVPTLDEEPDANFNPEDAGCTLCALTTHCPSCGEKI